MDLRWSIVTSETPETEPVSLDEAKSHVREVGSDQDSLIESLITAVRMTQESTLGRCFVTQTQVLRLSAFPVGAIEIPRAPVQTIESIEYVDADGVTQTMDEDEYMTSLTSLPPRISPAYATSWPSTRCQDDAVVVTFVGGYGDDASDVPAALKAALLLRLGDLYENRESKFVGTIVADNTAADMLEAPFKLWVF